MNAQVAVICTPQIPSPWTDADFVMRRIVNPACHAIAMACLLLVAVVQFVLPQLRDLIGNMVTTLAGCMIVARIANIVRIFVEYNGPVSYLTAGMCIVCIDINVLVITYLFVPRNIYHTVNT